MVKAKSRSPYIMQVGVGQRLHHMLQHLLAVCVWGLISRVVSGTSDMLAGGGGQKQYLEQTDKGKSTYVYFVACHHALEYYV
jgi:hypothetical protein